MRRIFGQSILEFTFASVATALLMVSMIRVFSWSARDLRARRIAHEVILVEDPGTDLGPDGPLKQLRTHFFSSANLETAVNSDIF